jgi:hypothetical protein
LDTDISFLPVYRITVKNYIKYQLFIALIRNFQINKLREIAANRKKRSKRIIKYTIINSEKWEAIKENERELQRNKEEKVNEFARKKQATAKKKIEAEVKKIVNTTNRAANKVAKESEAAKKNNEKDKKAGYSAIINEIEKAIQLLFQNIDYKEPNKVEIQLIAELEITTFNINQISQW